MIRGTTPTHRFYLPFGRDEIRALRVTYAQHGEVVLVCEGDDCRIEDGMVELLLTQEQTLRFGADAPVQIQLRVLTDKGEAYASRILIAQVGECLDGEVLA